MAFGSGLNPELVLRARDDTRAAFTSVNRSLGGLQASTGNLTRVLAGVGGVLSAGAFVGAIRSSIDLADQFNKLSQKVGVSVEQLSALKYAADLSDVSLEGLEVGLRQLSKSIDEGSDAFKRLGIDPRQFRDTNAVLLAVADRFAQVQDGASKTAIAMELFGRSGADLIPLLNQGSAGLKAMGDEASRLGLVMSSELARSAEEFNDAITRLGAQARGAGIQISNGLLPTLLEVTTQLNEGIRIAGGFFEAIRLFGTINPFRDLSGNIRALNAELADLERRSQQAVRFQSAEQSARAFAGAIGDVRKQLEFLKAEQQREALATTGGRRDLDPRDIRAAARQAPREVLPPKPETAARARGRQPSEFEGLIEVERSKSEFRRLVAEDLERQRTADAEDVASAERAQFEALLAVEQAKSEFRNLVAEDQERDRGEIEATAEAYRRLIDPARQYKQQLEEIKQLQDSGALTPDEAIKAREAIEKEIEAVGRKTNDVGRELGLTFSSAIEDAIVEMRDLGDVADAVLQDLTRLAVRKAITEPLLGAASGVLGGIFGGGAGGGGTGFAFAAGGIMTSRGPVDLRAFAGGGIADRRTLAMFGEGSTAEAFVPLPDGRRIPVKQLDGAAARTVSVTMNVYAQDAASFKRSERQMLRELRAQMEAVR